MEVKVNDNEKLDEVLELTIKIFKPNQNEFKKYHRKQLWQEKLQYDGLLLTANENNKIIGFAVCYKKENSFHIWNVGVLEEYRNKGIWKDLYSEILKYSQQKGYTKLTINTYKNRFPNMYNFLKKKEFEEIKVENKKSYFEKPLN